MTGIEVRESQDLYEEFLTEKSEISAEYHYIAETRYAMQSLFGEELRGFIVKVRGKEYRVF